MNVNLGAQNICKPRSPKRMSTLEPRTYVNLGAQNVYVNLGINYPCIYTHLKLKSSKWLVEMKILFLRYTYMRTRIKNNFTHMSELCSVTVLKLVVSNRWTRIWK